jgi:hypothetical protein
MILAVYTIIENKTLNSELHKNLLNKILLKIFEAGITYKIAIFIIFFKLRMQAIQK